MIRVNELIRENRPNLNIDKLKSSLDKLRLSGFITYLKRLHDGKEFTVNCYNIKPPGAAGHIAYACEVIADSVGLDPKEQVRYEPRKKLTIYPALKSAILDIFRD